MSQNGQVLNNNINVQDDNNNSNNIKILKEQQQLNGHQETDETSNGSPHQLNGGEHMPILTNGVEEKPPFHDNLLTAAVAAASRTSNRSPSPLNELKRIHRVVFTGGPCAGKTTTINRMRSFFQNIGWKVLTVPETATILLGTGVYFYELDNETKMNFQENLLKTLLQIENSINETAKYYMNEKRQNCMIIYDRGAMDPVAYLSPEDWEMLKMRNPAWNEVDLRDNRYDQIVHMVTAAIGAENYYTLENNVTRTESIEVAREIDERLSKVIYYN